MNTIKDNLSASELISFINNIIIGRKNSESFYSSFGVEEMNNGYGSIFIKPTNNLFKRIVVNKNENEVQSIVFYGDFQISFSELENIFGVFRLYYSPHDDLYHYFFNEDYELGNYTLKTYSSNNRNNIENWQIKNLEIFF